MENKLYSIAASATVWANTAGEALAERAAQAADATRSRLAEERGQTAAEYLGIILLVAVIIFAVSKSGIDTLIKDRLVALVNAIGIGGDPGAPAPAPAAPGKKPI